VFTAWDINNGMDVSVAVDDSRLSPDITRDRQTMHLPDDTDGIFPLKASSLSPLQIPRVLLSCPEREQSTMPPFHPRKSKSLTQPLFYLFRKRPQKWAGNKLIQFIAGLPALHYPSVSQRYWRQTCNENHSIMGVCSSKRKNEKTTNDLTQFNRRF
jgi:hypothetical protein